MDVQCCFNFTAVGNYGGHNDSEIFLNAKMQHLFRQGSSNIPPRRKICESYYEFQYFLVRNKLFSSHRWLMQPYSESLLKNEARKIFNYSLLRPVG